MPESIANPRSLSPLLMIWFMIWFALKIPKIPLYKKKFTVIIIVVHNHYLKMEECNHEKETIDSCSGFGHGRHNAYGLRRQNDSCGLLRADLGGTDCPPEESSVEPTSEASSSVEPTSEVPSTEPQEQVPAEETSLKVTYVTKYREESEATTAEESNIIEAMVEAFENAHPDINVEVTVHEVFTGGYTPEESLAMHIVGGEIVGGDVILNDFIVSYIGDATEDLTPYIENGDIDTSTHSDIAEGMKVLIEDNYLQSMLPTPGGESVGMFQENFGLENKEAALEFIDFICGEEGAAVYEENGIPVYDENINISNYKKFNKYY